MSPREILGTYDLEKKVEDTVVLLDATDKFYGDPNAAILIEQGLIDLVAAKYSIDPSDRFALVTFGEEVNVDMEFDAYSPDAFAEALEGVSLLGQVAYLAEGISIGLQLLIKELQRLSTGKCMRMLIVSDGVFHQKQKDWQELVEDAKGIGIFIDCIQVVSHQRGSEVLRRITRITEGDYMEMSYQQFPNNASSFAVKKRKASISQTTEDKGLPPALLEKIAAELDTIDSRIQTPQDLLEIALAEGDTYKCGICHSNYCMMCHGPPYACGAYCPQCGRFFHVHCAAGWAQNSKDTPSNVFKCPVCFYLLKVPGSLYRIEVLQNRLKSNMEMNQKKGGYTASKKPAAQLKDGLRRVCAYCHKILAPDEEGYQCGNPSCNAIYHLACFQEMAQVSGDRCRVCDASMNLKFGAHPGLSRIA